MKYNYLFSLLILISSSLSSQSLIPGQTTNEFFGTKKTIYLNVSDTIFQLDGKKTKMLTTNGQIPAPTLEFTEGDSAVIYVHNKTNQSVSFHWHGILLPNKEDGVPMLTTEIIKPGSTHLFKFLIKQVGTYWYHSHTGFQEQKGLYGAIVIHPKEGIKTKEKVVVLSDFTRQSPWLVQQQLKRHTDYYALKRNAIQSYGKAISTGNFSSKFWLEWKRMPDMDLADVYYDEFFANGMKEDNFSQLLPGEKVRVRIINGSASSHFWLSYAGGQLELVAADGIEVEPVKVDKLLIATAETYDFMITIPDNKKYELRATSWDVSNYTSVWFGNNERVFADSLKPVDYFKLVNEMKQKMAMMPNMKMGKAPKNIPQPKVYEIDSVPTYQEMEDEIMKEMMANKHEHMKHKPEKGTIIEAEKVDGMQMSEEMMESTMGVKMTGYQQIKEDFPDDVIFDYTQLKSKERTKLSEKPTRVVHLYLGGNMLRYVWMINNTPLSSADKIKINKGENVRFVLHNTTMMSHPMHLHGHFFRVINGQGDYSPLKHTVNVAPMENTIIEFEASEDKDWFFHCHLLYHMMSGMAAVINYNNTTPMLTSKKEYRKFTSHDKTFFPKAEFLIQSNATWADVSIFNIYNDINIEADGDYNGNYEVEGKWMRYIGPKQFFVLYGGTRIENEKLKTIDGTNTNNLNSDVIAGFKYMLPMFIWSDISVSSLGDVVLELERDDIAVTKRMRLNGGVEYNLNQNKWEYTIGSSYIITQFIGFSVNYDSNYKWGAGVKFMF